MKDVGPDPRPLDLLLRAPSRGLESRGQLPTTLNVLSTRFHFPTTGRGLRNMETRRSNCGGGRGVEEGWGPKWV